MLELQTTFPMVMVINLAWLMLSLAIYWPLNCILLVVYILLCFSIPLLAVGITNQRETSIVWDRTTGLPLCNAIGQYTVSALPSSDR